MAGKYRALLIGNSTYPADEHNLQTLKGPVKDIAVLNRALADRDTGLFADVDVTLLPEATTNRSVRALGKFFGTAERDDVLLFYFSGHGKLDQNGRLHLCMQDTESTDLLPTALSSTRINEFADASRARNVVIVLDCCYAGAFRGADLADPVAGPGRYVMTSCRGTQLANDATVENGTSLFTQHLVDGLVGAAVDHDNDGYVSFSDLYAYVDRQLRAAGKQIPQRRVSGDGDLRLARRSHPSPTGNTTLRAPMGIGQNRPWVGPPPIEHNVSGGHRLNKGALTSPAPSASSRKRRRVLVTLAAVLAAVVVTIVALQFPYGGSPGSPTTAANASGTSAPAGPRSTDPPATATPYPPASVATSGQVQHMLDTAMAQVGDKYVFGAGVAETDPDPDTWDNAELTQWAAHQAGVDIPGSSYEQYLYLKAKGLLIPLEQGIDTPGALLFHFSTEPTEGSGRPSEAHVAISLGDGRTVEAQSEEVGVITDEAAGRFEYAALLPGLDYSGTASALTIDQVLYGIRMQETGGNYQSEHPTSTASGAYNYIDGAWNGYGGYSHAADAPPDVQDAKMRADAQASYNRVGDWERVIAAHYVGEANQEGPKDNWSHQLSGTTLSIRDYVDGVLAFIHSAMTASSTPLITAATTG